MSGNTLSRQELVDIRKSIFIRDEKLMKIQNTISIFQSHKDNNTVPNALNFIKFPKPLWADDAIFVDEHYNIIRNAQSQMIDSIIARGKIIIDCLNVELSEIRNKIDQCYKGNKDRFIDNIKMTVSNNLKEYFESSNSKLLRLQNNYFEDHISTEYETQDISDEYINNYIQFNDENNKNYNDGSMLKQKAAHPQSKPQSNEMQNQNTHRNFSANKFQFKLQKVIGI